MTILLISFLDKEYSRSSVYMDKISIDNDEMRFLKLKPNLKQYSIEIWNLRKVLRNPKNKLIVMSPCHVLVPIIRVISNKKVILDAGWPLSDSTSIKSNKMVSVFISLKNHIIDFIAFNFSSMVILESQAQLNHVRRKFLVKKKKIRVIFTGLNENRFANSDPKFDLTILKTFGLSSDIPFVLFRGKNVRESGINNILDIAKEIYVNIKIVIATNTPCYDAEIPNNVVIITKKLSENEIAALYRNSFLNIGQMSNSKRLNFTIPHKAFESGYFGKPYLAISRSAIRELYPYHNSITYIDNLEISEVARKVEFIYLDFKTREELEIEIRSRYALVASQEVLQRSFRNIFES